MANISKIKIDNVEYTIKDANAIARPTSPSNGKILKYNGTSWVADSEQDISGLAPKASPALTGTPTAPTAAAGTNTTQIATTAFVKNAVSTATAGLSGAMHFLGETTTAVSNGSTTATVSISGSNVTAKSGDVVLKDSKEFVFNGASWKELGDESSHALKTVQIKAGSGLSGGGTLASDITINHSNSVTAVTTAGLLKVEYDENGHITGTAAVEKSDITALGIPAQDTTYTLSDLGGVPDTRTINGKRLNTNITLGAANIALATDWAKASTATLVAAGDTLAVAIGKLQKAIDGKQASGSYLTTAVTSLGGKSGALTVKSGSITNGTVNFSMNGTELNGTVYGLGSAAYTASTAYATAAQGSLADGAIQKPTSPINGQFLKYNGTSWIADSITIPTVPEALKNPAALTVGSKSYDGSSAVTITATDLGALTDYDKATFTVSGEVLTISYT